MSRVAGLLAIAVLPAAAGLAPTSHTLDLANGFDTAMYMSAGFCAWSEASLSWLTIRTVAPVRSVRRADVSVPCQDPCLADEEPSAASCDQRSFGNPSTRSPMMLRWICDVPAAMRIVSDA